MSNTRLLPFIIFEKDERGEADIDQCGCGGCGRGSTICYIKPSCSFTDTSKADSWGICFWTKYLTTHQPSSSTCGMAMHTRNMYISRYIYTCSMNSFVSFLSQTTARSLFVHVKGPCCIIRIQQLEEPGRLEIALFAARP